jgi:GT2 family glycosyltransferase
MQISIAIPYFNRLALLRLSIISMIVQKPNITYEIIIVNDGPPDKALECELKGFVSKNKLNIRLFNTFRTYDYRGPAYAWNCAIKKCSSDNILMQSPEVLHVGPVINTIYKKTCHSNKPYYCMRCYGLDCEQTKRIKKNEKIWSKNTNWFKGIDTRNCSEYCGLRRNKLYYFLAGLKRSDFLSIGGIDERFTHMAYEDANFARLVKLNNFNRAIITDRNVYGLHMNHQRPTNDDFNNNRKRMYAINKSIISEWQTSHEYKSNINVDFGILPDNSEVSLH